MQPTRSDSSCSHKISTTKPQIRESLKLSQRIFIFRIWPWGLNVSHAPGRLRIDPNLLNSKFAYSLPSQKKNTYLWTKSWIWGKPGYLRGTTTAVVCKSSNTTGSTSLSSLPTTPLPLISIFGLISAPCPICPNWFLQRSNIQKSEFYFHHLTGLSNSTLGYGAPALLMFVLRPVSPIGTEVPWGQGFPTACSTALNIRLSLTENLMNSIKP